MPLFRTALLTVGVCLGGAWSAGNADAQQRGEGPPPVQPETLSTKDGVKLHIKYYPSTAGREATPVILVHDLKESGKSFSKLARRLQQPPSGEDLPPFAVVTVDLRGHGDSRKQEYQGRSRELDAAKLRMEDLAGMVRGDLEAVSKFLVGENDAGKLNLNRLAIVGAGMGAVVATNFAAFDWAAPRLASVKQGQDVKALVLISPEWKFKGLSMQAALRQPGVQRKVACLMLYGNEDRRRTRDAERVYGQLERGHPGLRSKKKTDLASQLEQLPAVMKIGSKTKLQGTQLLNEKGEKAYDLIARFLTKHTGNEDFEHSVRRKF